MCKCSINQEMQAFSSLCIEINCKWTLCIDNQAAQTNGWHRDMLILTCKKMYGQHTQPIQEVSCQFEKIIIYNKLCKMQ